MAELSARTNTPISTAELQRRWTAVIKSMQERRIAALVMQNNNDFMGGYVKYFTDLPATNGYPFTVIFPADDGMTLISQGPFGLERELPPQGDGLRRGVKRIMATSSFCSASYTRTYDAELAVKALGPYAHATIGLVGTASMPHAFADHLKRELAGASFVEASDLVDEIRAVKSAEEIELMRRTATMQDEQMTAAFAALEPGKRDIDVAAVAELLGHRLGSEQGLFLTASGPLGAPPVHANRHQQYAPLRSGDQFTLLVENSGAGGLFTEIARTCVLGKASAKFKDDFAFALEARHFTLKMLKPGASGKDIWEAYNQFMREHGKPPEQRVYCHGQGYDMVERPLVRFDEPMPIKANMVLACHPSWTTDQSFAWVCDNYLVTEGSVERLHKFPEVITEIG